MSTAEQTTHTPGPWVASAHFAERHGGRTYIPILRPGNDPAPIAVVHRDVDGYGRAEGEANAAFIVRACNAHDELVEALSALLSLHGTPHQDEWLNPQAFKFAQDVTDKARAALSKATGR